MMWTGSYLMAERIIRKEAAGETGHRLTDTR